MKIIDIVAILGALAWLPQIFSWVYSWFQKPKITVFHDSEAEVGFILFGNTLNIRLSFLAKHKHALIDDITLNVTDKNGATHQFKWVWYSETFYEIQAPGGTTTMAKRQNAIAINAYKDALIEKFVGFQSTTFLNERKQLIYRLKCFIENHKKGGNVDAKIIKASNEYNNLLRFYKNSIMWKTGDYNAICKIHIADTDEVINHKFGFKLSDIEIDTLNENIKLVETLIYAEFIEPNTPINGKWLWVNPQIQ